MFKIHPEVMISLAHEDCDYYREDFKRSYYNFEYPKLIINSNNNPMIAYVDEKSNKLIIAEAGNKVKILYEHGPFQENNLLYKWPVVLDINKDIYFASIGVSSKGKEIMPYVKLFYYDKSSNSIDLKLDMSSLNPEIIKSLQTKSGLSFAGIYSIGMDIGRLFIVGSFTDSHFHPLSLFSAEPVRFTKNYSFDIYNNNIANYQLIEIKGWFSANHINYSTSNSGLINSIWVRDTSKLGEKRHTETLCFSECKYGEKWKEPVKIYSVKATDKVDHLRNLSVNAVDNSIVMIWQDIEKGIYFTEIKNGKIQEQLIINEEKELKEIEGVERPRKIEYLQGAPTAKITSDDRGNVFVFWVKNEMSNHEIYLRTRLEGKWRDKIIISKGRGTVKLPDIKVDNNGKIHIAYVKEMQGGRVGCYYSKIETERW